MHIKNLHHRHYVAVPVAALLLAVSFLVLGGSPTVTASVTALAGSLSAASSQPFTTLAGQYGILENGEITSGLDGILLTHGTLTVASSIFSTVSLNDHASITSFHGAVAVTRSDKNLTIAALSTPAVLRTGDDLFLIPTGYHASMDASVMNSDEILGGVALETLPRTFTEEALAKLDGVHKPVSGVLSLTSIAPFAPNPLVIAPESLEREREQWAERTVQAMLAQLHKKSTAIDDGIWANLEGTEALKSHISDLIGAGVQDADLLARLVPKLLSPEQRLLSYVHPSLRGAAWYGQIPEREEESIRRALITGLPLTDTAAEELSDFIVFRWERMVGPTLSDRSGVTNFFDNALPPIDAHLKRIREHGYPERFTRFTHALQTLASVTQFPLSGDALGRLDDLRRIETLPATDVAGSATSSNMSSSSELSSSVSPAPVFSEAEQEQRAMQTRAMLSERGAVFSMETALAGQPDGTVQVTNIVFSTAEQSHVYSFTFTPVTAELSAITRDGQPQAYGLSLEAFIAWATNQ